MKTGRELDALVAEKVMGWTRHADKHDMIAMSPPNVSYGAQFDQFPHYSTDIVAAWQVVENLCNWDEDDNMLTLKGQGDPDPDETWWEADISGTLCEHFIGKAATASLAICLAALRAKGINVDAEDAE